MILLSVQAELVPDRRDAAAHASPFLGGALHGIFESMILQWAPECCATLGLLERAATKHYAIAAPPYCWRSPMQDGSYFFSFGVMLYGDAAKHAIQIARALHNWKWLNLSGRHDYVKNMEIRACVPNREPRLLSADTDAAAIAVLTDTEWLCGMHTHPCQDLTIEWITPLILDSVIHRTHDGAYAINLRAVTLLKIIRSIASKIQILEPVLADVLGIGSAAWIESEESVRQSGLGQNTLQLVSWSYGSSTKTKPHGLRGVIGEIRYIGYIPANIRSLMEWGSWFGAGQSRVLGNGMYWMKELN
jgi:hypothetical protein